MKKSELRQIIREEIQLIIESKNGNQVAQQCARDIAKLLNRTFVGKKVSYGSDIGISDMITCPPLMAPTPRYPMDDVISDDISVEVYVKWEGDKKRSSITAENQGVVIDGKKGSQLVSKAGKDIMKIIKKSFVGKKIKYQKDKRKTNPVITGTIKDVVVSWLDYDYSSNLDLAEGHVFEFVYVDVKWDDPEFEKVAPPSAFGGDLLQVGRDMEIG